MVREHRLSVDQLILPMFAIAGAGRDQTVIEGDLVLTGNGYALSGFTLTGDLYLRGNKCTIDIDVQGKKDVAGTGNTVK